jgi:hypothetical protein
MRVSEEKHTARAQILGEANTFHGPGRLAKGKGEEIRKPLSHAAFKPDWRGSHGFIPWGIAVKP